MYGWVPSVFTQNYHNTVNWLYSNTKQKVLLKKVLKKCFTNLHIKNYCPHSPKKPDYFYKHIEGTKEHVRNQKRKLKKKMKRRDKNLISLLNNWPQLSSLIEKEQKSYTLQWYSSWNHRTKTSSLSPCSRG